MRVQGNVYPETITVETYLPIQGMSEVRLRENVTQLAETLYEYDEYTKLVYSDSTTNEMFSEKIPNWTSVLKIEDIRSVVTELSSASEIIERLDTMELDYYSDQISAYDSALLEIEAAIDSPEASGDMDTFVEARKQAIITRIDDIVTALETMEVTPE